MNDNELKVFTLEEANRILPKLSELIDRLHEKQDHIGEIEVEIDTLELINDPAKGSSAPTFEKLLAKHRQLVGEFYAIVDQIHSYGCFLKDADMGLIDFYGVVEGRVVYFCWHTGEEQVNFWHEVGQGYANREPLEN